MSKSCSRNEFIVFICVASIALLSATTAQAVDGRIEINQTCATMTGCGPGADAAGFPVVVDTSGSYVLTSNLLLTGPGTDGIFVSGVDLSVDIDLNGFTIDNPAGGSGSGDGISVANGGDSSVRVRNGYIRRLGDRGLNGVQLVENVTVEGCGGAGIATRFQHESVVRDAQVRNNGGAGLQRSTSALSRVLVSGSQFSGNAASWGTANPGSIVPIGGNFCDDGLCTSDGRKLFYLTTTTHNGANALTACAADFHMAALWEIHDVSNLAYDFNRGEALGDSGPPTGVGGWVRTGNSFSQSSTPGGGNCTGYTGTNGDGTYVELPLDWTAASGSVSPWEPQSFLCTTPQKVWCVED